MRPQKHYFLRHFRALKIASTKARFPRSRQKSGRAKGAAKGSCGEIVQKGVLESPFLLCSLKAFRDLSCVLRANLKGAEKKRTLQKHPFGQPFLRTTPSPLLWRALKKEESEPLEPFFRTRNRNCNRPSLLNRVKPH